MKRINITVNQQVSREDLANPFRNIPYCERLKMAGVEDISDTHVPVTMPNGKLNMVPKNTDAR